MEKLQAALDNARKQRQSGPGTVRLPRAATRVAAPDSVDELWQALPPLEVPEKVLREHRVVTRRPSADAAPFDVLRTKVLLQMRRNGWKSLAITSPMPRSGKTTIACNLALGLGRQSDLRAILMDLDLRDPAIHRFFEVEPEHGIGEVLSGQVDFADQAMRIGDNVAVSMMPYPESDPARVLMDDETERVLDGIIDRYQPDITIFDMPSVLVNDDTRAFLKNADCALIVLRANATRYGQFDTCEREVAEHTNVLGVVLNACNNVDLSDSA